MPCTSHSPSHVRTLAPRTVADERGAALVIALMSMTLLTALGTALVIGTVLETAIAASYREGVETFYAAEAAVGFVIQELAASSDWDCIRAGEATSMFVDGPPSGTRSVGATTVDLTQVIQDVNALAATGPDGTRSTYQLYAYGRFADMVSSASPRSPLYVLVWIADQGEGDDGSPVLGLVGRAYGPSGSRRSVAVSVTRLGASAGTPPEGVRVVSWHELR